MPLTKEQVLEKKKDPFVVLLNVLPEKDFEKLHIKDSENLPLGQNIRGFAMAALKKYSKQTFFITYGADKESTVALNAAKVLLDKGLRADHFPGGLQEWSQAGLSLGGTDRPRESPRPLQLSRKEK